MTGEGTGVRVLVVEDDQASAELLVEALQDKGYTVDCAQDGNRAVTMVCTNQYDAVLLDLRLPEYDGVEVLRIIRSRQLHRRTCVIVVSGDDEATRRPELNRDGIEGYISKPVDLSELGRQLAHALRRFRAA